MAAVCFSPLPAVRDPHKGGRAAAIAGTSSARPAVLGARRPAAAAPAARRGPCRPAASAAAAVEVAADQWVQATGVPLLQHMQSGSLQAAAVLGAQVLVGLAVATVAGRAFLRWADARFFSTDGPGSRDAGSWAARAGRYLLSSLLHQAQVLLPWVSGLYAATAVAALMQVRWGVHCCLGAVDWGRCFFSSPAQSFDIAKRLHPSQVGRSTVPLPATCA